MSPTLSPINVLLLRGVFTFQTNIFNNHPGDLKFWYYMLNQISETFCSYDFFEILIFCKKKRKKHSFCPFFCGLILSTCNDPINKVSVSFSLLIVSFF